MKFTNLWNLKRIYKDIRFNYNFDSVIPDNTAQQLLKDINQKYKVCALYTDYILAYDDNKLLLSVASTNNPQNGYNILYVK